MFPRISKSKKKSGTYEYLVISESFHVKGKGSTTRNIANLGNIKKFTQKNIESLIDGLIRLFKIEKYGLSDQVQILESLEHGSIIFWQKIWNKFDMSNEIKKIIKQKHKKMKIDAEKYIELMVINRCVAPLSKLGTTRWMEHTCYKAMRGYHDLKSDVEYFYRSMDYLLSIKDELEFALYEKMKTLFSINVKLTFYDITSSFFYTNICPIGKKGYSRDKRPDKEQIVIGVVTSFEGYPIKHFVFEGNTKDDTTVIDVVKKLKDEYNIEETVFVGDRGMITKLNLSTIEEQGFDYIMGVKFRQNEICEMLFDECEFEYKKYQDYRGLKIQEKNIAIKDFLCWKTTKILSENNIKICDEKFDRFKESIFSLKDEDEFNAKRMRKILTDVTADGKTRGRILRLIKKYDGQYEKEIRTIICLNEERKAISKLKRELKVSNLSESLSEIFSNAKTDDKICKAEKQIDKIFEGSMRRFRKFFNIHRNEEDKAVDYTLNEGAVKENEKFDGVFVLTTNRHDFKAEKVVDSYKNLKEVEMLFDDLKHFVDIRPIRHWLEIRVRSHVFLCMLALLLKRTLEINYIKGKATMHPLEEISKCKLVRYKVKFSEREDRSQTFPKVTQITKAQKELFNLVGIKNPMSLENYIW
jgi:transposase